MNTLSAETVIPKYAFEEDVATGNEMFKILKSTCSVRYHKADMLVPHRKDYYFFVFVKQGNSRHWIDMTLYTLQPDTFYFSVPHQVHLKEEAKPFTGSAINFTDEFLAMEENGFLKQLPIIQNRHNGHELNLSSDDVVFIEDMLNKIHTEYNAKHSWKNSMLVAYMQVLLIYLSRLYTEQFTNADQAPEKLLLKRYLARIEDDYKEIHDVAAYADMLNITAGHLSEVVKKQSGKTAMEHIHERLELEAKRLLFHTDHSIKEIAFELGFEDASYFNRFFKRLAQQTPADYRKTTRHLYH